MNRIGSLAVVIGLTALGSAGPSAQQPADRASAAAGVMLRPTNHPRLPADPTQLWMVPPVSVSRSAAVNEFISGVKLEVEGNFTKALPIFSQSRLQDHPLADYVTYYKGLAELRTGRLDEARRTFQALEMRGPDGYVAEAAALREAECNEALGNERAALAIYERLSKTKTTAPDDVLMRMGRAAHVAGDLDKALTAFSLVYYEFPFSDLSPAADLELDRLPNRPPIAAGTNRFKLELGRAEQLFATKRYTLARQAFDKLQGAAQGDDRELVNLRLAECEYFLKRLRNARDGVKPYIEHAKRQGEALFFYAIALRDLGERDEYLRLVHRLVDEFPTQTWSEEALNSLATYYILQDDDVKAGETFREMYDKFPSGRNAERAAWKIGWAAYRNGQYAETIRVFESAAANFPRSDYRPPWLYWAGRAREQLNDTAKADAMYRLAAADYRNSYYGRLALTHVNAAAAGRRLVVTAPPPAAADAALGGEEEAVPAAPLPPNQDTIRALLGVRLYDQALDELRYARTVWGESPAIDATFAWIYQKQGQAETGDRQFALFRAAINTMKRAYPQFMAAGGEGLPRDLLKVIFPIGYWDLIRKYSSEQGLDPYVVAALMAQESTFVPNIVSYAKAVGLMQLEAGTAREYAKKLGMRYSPKLLTTPETNIKLGTAMLADHIKRFGELHLVLASYNAGAAAVRRWMAARPGLSRDEFIDDIPFPETQGYVRKILGTAEDYRVLYGPDATVADSNPAPKLAAAAPAPAPAAKRASSHASPAKKKLAPVRSKPRKAA